LEKPGIIWDYDGTILPFTPYDSEQFLLNSLLTKNKFSLLKKFVAIAAIWADNKQLLGHSFKRYYNWLLKKIPLIEINNAANEISALIPDSYIEVLKFFARNKFQMSIISCGTGDLCVNSLKRKNANSFFKEIISNFFVYKNGKIDGMIFNVLKGSDKIRYAQKLGFKKENTIAVGDGYTDIPLLDWVKFPIMLDPDGKKKIKYADKNYVFLKNFTDLKDVICSYMENV
jgi:phosphoserine phosphatase